MSRLSHLDQATGLPVRRPKPLRYEHKRPGDMVHVDIKKLSRLPGGGGHRMIGRAAGTRNKTRTEANRRPGYAYLHHAVDDYSRLAYSEILTDEKKKSRRRVLAAGPGVLRTPRHHRAAGAHR